MWVSLRAVSAGTASEDESGERLERKSRNVPIRIERDMTVGSFFDEPSTSIRPVVLVGSWHGSVNGLLGFRLR